MLIDVKVYGIHAVREAILSEVCQRVEVVEGALSGLEGPPAGGLTTEGPTTKGSPTKGSPTKKNKLNTTKSKKRPKKQPKLNNRDYDKDYSRKGALGFKSRRILDIIKLCEARGINIVENGVDSFVDENGKAHEVSAQVKKKNIYKSLESYIKERKDNPPTLLTVLDGIKDPHNLGAILRSIEHFGGDGLILAKDKSAKVSSTVYKVSSGAAYYVPIIEVTNLKRSLDYLKREENFWVYGLDVGGEVMLDEVEFSGRVVLVVGSEGFGIRKLVKESCDFVVGIRNLGNIESLNVSVATGICLYEIRKQIKSFIKI